jgi:hypothetical protein
MSATDLIEPVTTITTSLRPIDRDGLLAFAEKGRNNPGLAGHQQGPHRDGRAVPLAELRGQPRARGGGRTPAPVWPGHGTGARRDRAVGLGGCLAVGITAVATWKQVKLSKIEIHMEGDIGNPAAWGAGGALEKTPLQMGFQAIRVKGRHRRRCHP